MVTIAHCEAQLSNPLATLSNVGDWGKQCARANEYLQKYKIQAFLGPEYTVLHSDELATISDEIIIDILNINEISVKNNSPGFDIIIIHNKTKKVYRIQSKLRQVKGKDPYSTQVDFETTRRNSEKNKDNGDTGHVSYSTNEFDFVMVTLVHIGKEKNLKIRESHTEWVHSFIPIDKLCKNDKELLTKIPAVHLNNYKVANKTLESILLENPERDNDLLKLKDQNSKLRELNTVLVKRISIEQ